MAALPGVTASYAISVRRASVLPAASFRFHLAVGTLAVRLVVPLAGSTGDLHPQVIRPAPPVPEQRPSRRYAPCLAHHKKKPAEAGFEGLFRFSTVLLIGQSTNLLPLKAALIDHEAGTDCAY